MFFYNELKNKYCCCWCCFCCCCFCCSCFLCCSCFFCSCLQKVVLFLKEVPVEIEHIRKGIKAKEFNKVITATQKIKPTLDLLGMDLAVEELNQVITWAEKEGKKKEIVEVFKLLNEQIELSCKEIKKNYKIK